VLSWVVNSRRHLCRTACALNIRESGEKHANASTFRFKRLRTLSFSVSSKSFACHSYENCRVSPPSPIKNFKSYLRFAFPGRALCSLFSLLAPRVFHNSLAIKRFHTLSENSRGVHQLFPKWNRFRLPPSPFQPNSSHHPPITSLPRASRGHFLRLTPSLSADSINLHLAERQSRRQSHPHGGVP